MSADTVEFKEDFASLLTERGVRTRSAFPVADNERLPVLVEHSKKGVTEQSKAARTPFDCRASSF